MNYRFTHLSCLRNWLLPAMILGLLCPSAIQAQITLNCPPNVNTTATNGQCARVVTYSPPTTNAQTSTTQTFSYTGGLQTFTVPSGVSSVGIQAWGGQGRTNAGGNISGRNGGYATGNLAVSPGNTLYIYVGGGGGTSTAGGYNGGGSAGAQPCVGARGGGGGGASDVRLNSTSLAARRIVAGGGGGAGGNRVSGCGRGSGGGGGGGYYGGGGGAGWPFGSTTLPSGGTQTAGGNGGTSTYTVPGNNGGAGGAGFGGFGGAEESSTQGGSGNALTGGVGGGNSGGGGQYSVNWTGQSGAGGSGYIGGVSGGSMSSGIRSGNGQVVITYSVPVSVTQTGGLPSGGNFPVGTTVNSFSVSQGTQTATCSFTVTVSDNQQPSVTCPGTQSINLNGSCQATMPDYRSMANASDNCTSNPNKSQSPSPGATVSGTGNQTVTITATDGAGNTQNCTFTLTKVDVTDPTISCPATQTLSLNSSCSASLPSYTSAANVSDNCTAAPAVTQSPAAGTTVNGIGTTTVALTVTDGAGRTASCNLTVNKVDVTAPAVTCPSNQNVNLNASCSASVANFIPQASASDGCTANPTMTQSPTAGTTINSGGSQTITISAVDGSSNTGNCTFTLTAADNVDPSVTCPGNQSVTLDATCGGAMPDYTGSASASDNCSAGLTVTQSPAPASALSGTGTVTITMTATDGSGNTDDCNFTLTKNDATAPTLNCPATVNLNLNAVCQATLPSYAAQSNITDNCSSNPTVVQNPVAGTLVSGTGTTNVTLTATDGASNSGTCTIAVVKVDATDPTVTCPANQSVSLSSNCTASMPNYVPQSVATDNCTGNPTRTQAPAAGSTISSAGPQTVTITATDGAGNSDNCTFTVTANDVTNPTITCPPSQTFSLSANCTAQIPDLTTTTNSADNCTSSPALTQSPTAGTTVSGAGAQPVTLTATDGSGNTANCTVNITFQDLVAPSVTCPGNGTISLNPNCQALVPNYTGQASASDNCTATPTKTQSPAPNTLFTGGGPHTVTITAADGASNTDTCTFQISGIDQVPPSITCPGTQTLALDANCVGTLPDYGPMATATDNCTSNPAKSQVPAPGTTFNGAGTTSVTITTTDGSSLTDDCTFTVDITDQTGPTVTCPPNDTIFTDANCEALLPDYTSTTSNVDNCSTVLNLSQSPFGGTTITGVGTTVQVTMTALDQAGNPGDCTHSVTLADSLAPAFSGCPTVINVTPPSFDCNPAVQWTPPTATDACATTVNLVSSHNPGGQFPIGTTTVTYTANDPNGNTSQCQFDVVVNSPVVDGFVTADLLQPCDGDTVLLSAFSGMTSYQWSTSETSTDIQVTTNGWYWVDMSDANNCTARDSIFVNFLAAPFPSITVNGIDLCTTPFASYQWFLNGTAIPGATSQCFTPTTSGNFTVAVTAPNGCEGESSVLAFVGVDDNAAAQDFALYPNPARDAVNVRLRQPLLEPGMIMIYDMAGRIVQRIDFEMLDTETALDLSRVADGAYFVEIISGEFRGRKKLVRIN